MTVKSPDGARGKAPRIVLTGGPAAGKTAVCEVLRKQLQDELVVLPETATMLFSSGFPRPRKPAGVRLVQQTIFAVQHNLESIHEISHPDMAHICDRGTLDGAAYWPGGLDRFLGAMGTTLEAQYRRYDAVIFLRSSAHGQGEYHADGSVRIETAAQARRIDQKLERVWENHPNFHLVDHEVRFYEKVAAVLIALERSLGLGLASKSATKKTARKRSR